jgi:flagellar M-ring protein FliF
LEQFIKQVSNNFIEFFRQLDTVRKIGLVALAGIVLAIMVGIVSWAAKTQYKVLYSDLNKEDSATIARLLEDKKISYQIDEDGKVIKVPEDQVDIWRLELAKQGVNFSGTVGYEVFDKQSFGTTSFVQKVNKQRALEGELVKTIKHISGVKRARVHLSLPESSPFVSEQKPASASVVLELDHGVNMTPEEIRGVASLVSSSVDGMRQDNVVILDHRGKRLSENATDKMSAETASKMALEGKINRKYEEQIEEILSRVVGDGKVIAKVAVSLDYSEKVETETTYDNENKAVVSEVVNSQKLQGSRPSPQGIPGARSNLPGETPQPGIPETRNDVDKALTTRNYQVPMKIVNAKKPSADVQNLSVAVMIDGKHVPVLTKAGTPLLDDNGVPVTKYQPWSEAEIANFQAIVSSTIGLNAVRGDKITIKNMEFVKEDLASAEALLRERENREIIKNIIKYLAIGLVITLFFFIVIRPFIQWITENTVESIEDFLPKTIEELEKIQANQKLPGLEDALPTIEEKLNPEKVEGNMLKEKIITLIEANPAKAAQVMHEMIHTVESDKQIA